ncbi:hypothetical protein FIBSPDRAFT_926408 [Athelia psychrophila]|uniref:Uncharacterized protein n=1 Tax=Athelia psychrophila TaxID=1759441 RepID=A0A166TFH4_9AGAM|nr:hypothetical protein FIBSPDRAFT_926408 [Fibularhizoctonia sp. CBS 109695]
MSESALSSEAARPTLPVAPKMPNKPKPTSSLTSTPTCHIVDRDGCGERCGKACALHHRVTGKRGRRGGPLRFSFRMNHQSEAKILAEAVEGCVRVGGDAGSYTALLPYAPNYTFMSAVDKPHNVYSSRLSTAGQSVGRDELVELDAVKGESTGLGGKGFTWRPGLSGSYLCISSDAFYGVGNILSRRFYVPAPQYYDKMKLMRSASGNGLHI